MKKFLLFFCVFGVCLSCIPVCADGPGQISACSAVVIENTTGRIIYEKNAYQKLPMASTTKIMTAICAIENSDPEKLITVNDGAVGIEGSSIYLAKGEKITVRELLYGTMLNSGNDAATALAYEIGGSVEGFAKMMNETASSIGATDTNFVNACGLYEEDHYTTAYDLARISAYALSNPLFAEIAACKNIRISNGDKGYPRILNNHNKLLSMYDGCIGVKTGYTKKCGRCLVSAAVRGDVTLTCVTLNAPDDWNDHIKMLDYGFSMVSHHTVAEKNDYCMSLKTADSPLEYAKLSFEDDLSYVKILGESDKTEIVYDVSEPITAGTKSGSKVGIAKLVCNGSVVAQSDIVCLDDVPPNPVRGYGERVGDVLKEICKF